MGLRTLQGLAPKRWQSIFESNRSGAQIRRVSLVDACLHQKPPDEMRDEIFLSPNLPPTEKLIKSCPDRAFQIPDNRFFLSRLSLRWDVDY
jgi:hypothetical protein